MNLSDALGLGARETVAITGAGGKTSALYRLAAECIARGQTVVATTTTHMWPPCHSTRRTVDGWPLVLGDASTRTARVAQALAAQGRAFVGSGVDAGGRLLGIPPEDVAALAALADIVLVEADGARGLWLKAPAEHEPVIPPEASLVVPVAGLRALGRPLGASAVHRPERVAEILHVELGAPVGEEMLAGLFVHAQGALRGVPAGARVVPFCNHAEGAGARAAGRRIASRVLRAGGRVQRVVVGSLRQAPGACEAWAPSAVIVLAAGSAQRFQRLKQEEEWQGRPFLARAADAALASLATQVRVVLGCEAARLEPLLAGYDAARLQVVLNPGWAEGMASSLRAGLRALSDGVQVAVFCAADQPLLTGAEIDLLLARHAAGGAPIVAPSVQGELRSPVLFARPLFAELAALQGDVGGRAVMRRHPAEVDVVVAEDPAPYTDVDTAEDLRQLLDRQRGN